jgi:hypothetical protein
MINIQSNDSHIINRDQLIIALCDNLKSGKPFDIHLNGEGPCADSLGLYDLLDQLCTQYEYDKAQISVETCNLIEHHPVYKIVIKPQLYYLDSARKFFKNQQLPLNKEFNSDFRYFGYFIGHGNIHRLHLASQIQKKYTDLSLYSYHYRLGEEYHRPFVGLEDMMFMKYSPEEIDQAFCFLKNCPIYVDEINEYPILNPVTYNVSKVYHQFFLELVSLTYFSGQTFYIDEKIWRPMIMRTPFMIQGPKNFLKNLRSLGFLTFDRWWDEGYNEDPGRSQVDGILRNIAVLSKYTLTEIRDLYEDMRGVLEHNFQRVLEIKAADFISKTPADF